MTPHRIATGTCLALTLTAALLAHPARASEPGIYVEDAAAKTETAVVGSVTLDFKGKNLGASMVTFGLVKPKLIYTFDGARAELRLPAQPAFRFHFGPKVDPRSPAMQDPALAMKMMSGEGMPLAAARPEDFFLVALDVVGDARQITLKQRRSTPYPTNATVAFAVEKLGDGDFRVRPKSPLPHGEYGFFCAAPGAMPEIWSFGVD
ncbi:MAG: hypothetical protein ACM3OB_01765 [Acidobacteriota bacterium]